MDSTTLHFAAERLREFADLLDSGSPPNDGGRKLSVVFERLYYLGSEWEHNQARWLFDRSVREAEARNDFLNFTGSLSDEELDEFLDPDGSARRGE